MKYKQCDGTGKSMVFSLDRPGFVSVKCKTCNGTGTLSEKKERMIKEGQELRKAIERKLGATSTSSGSCSTRAPIT